MANICSECGKHPALTKLSGRRVKAKNHDLCQRCFRSGNNSRRNEATKTTQENIGQTAEDVERNEWESFLAAQ